jgi:hypothetical protein
MSFASKFVADAKAFKSEILKIVSKTPAIVAEIDKDAPTVTALVELAFPGAAAIETSALAVVDAVQAVVTQAGVAAVSNGINAVEDKGVIAAIEAVVAAVKKL